MLRGKSPCPRAESASGRPRGAGHDACSETIGGAAVPCRGHSHQHSYVVSAQPRAPTERGSLSCCLLTADKQHAALPTLGHKRLIRFAVADACTAMLGIACLLDRTTCPGTENWATCSAFPLSFRGQGKHDFAVHSQGARSHRRCVESPRVSGQRVPVGDRAVLVVA